MKRKTLDRLIDIELARREDEMDRRALDECATQVSFKDSVPEYLRELYIIHCAALLMLDKVKMN